MRHKVLRQYLAKHDNETAAQIAAGVGRTEHSVKTDLGKMVQHGLLYVSGRVKATTGRPANRWSLTELGRSDFPATYSSRKMKHGPPKSLFLRAQMAALNEQIEAMEERMPLNPTPPDIHQAIASQPAVFHAWANLREAA